MEMTIFDNSTQQGWCSQTTGWGHLAEQARIVPIGESAADFGDVHPLHIAKFVDSNVSGIWHGYPADPDRLDQDVPPPEIQAAWLALGVIKTGHVRKMQRRLKCGL